MAFAIKTGIPDPPAKAFNFTARKTMHSGGHVAADDIVVLFASENEGGRELNFRFYRQATNKIVGITDGAASFLDRFF
ncbi:MULTISPECIES: hypothetical protein [unclassified Bradyrhizobium]|uniref:hypothetical protein n=1 Tax=unclassified Bradyrhizobium TaxID=2631580 RepID=UPI0004006253|nr:MULTISPECIES: hypothetical protein [unclassified Bradyrhizobium]QIG93011.1 hypothetical protein G6P99_11245 [Bradyrhizobium sp. 6(2017)]